MHGIRYTTNHRLQAIFWNAEFLWKWRNEAIRCKTGERQHKLLFSSSWCFSVYFHLSSCLLAPWLHLLVSLYTAFKWFSIMQWKLYFPVIPFLSFSYGGHDFPFTGRFSHNKILIDRNTMLNLLQLKVSEKIYTAERRNEKQCKLENF